MGYITRQHRGDHSRLPLHDCDVSFSQLKHRDISEIRLNEQEVKHLFFNISCQSAKDVAISVTAEDESIAKISELGSGVFDLTNHVFNTTVEGLQFGRTNLKLRIFDDVSVLTQESYSGDGEEELLSNSTHSLGIVVVRNSRNLTLAFQIILGLMIVIYNFGFGCKVDPQQIKAILKKPIAPVIGFVCQFGIMAPLAFGIAQLLKLDNEAGLGLLAIGCSPGGGGSNIFAFLLDADLELSITLTFISTVASLGMTPFWMWLLGRHYTEHHGALKVPIANVFASLAVVTIPVSLGVLLAHFKPKIALKAGGCLKPATAIIGVTFLGLGTYVYWYALIRTTWRTLVACSVVPFCGYMIGLTAGKAFKQGTKQAVTISLETGFQNLALAMFMLSTSMEPPESDFAGVIPICYTFLSGAYPTLTFLGYHMYKHIKKCIPKYRLDSGELNGAQSNVSQGHSDLVQQSLDAINVSLDGDGAYQMNGNNSTADKTCPDLGATNNDENGKTVLDFMGNDYSLMDVNIKKGSGESEKNNGILLDVSKF